MLTISQLKRWSINYYIDTAQAAKGLQRAIGGLVRGALLAARDPHAPLAAGRRFPYRGDPVGLTDLQQAGGDANSDVVARWLDDAITPSGAHGRAFGACGVHGFDLTLRAPSSVSLVRVLRTDDVAVPPAHEVNVASELSPGEP